MCPLPPLPFPQKAKLLKDATHFSGSSHGGRRPVSKGSQPCMGKLDDDRIVIDMRSINPVERIEQAVETCEARLAQEGRSAALQGVLQIFESLYKGVEGFRDGTLLFDPAPVDTVVKLLHYLAKLEGDGGASPAPVGGAGRGQSSPFSAFPAPASEADENFCAMARCLKIACEIIAAIDREAHFQRRMHLTLGLVSSLVHLLLVNEARWSAIFSESLLESCLLGMWKQTRTFHSKRDDRKVKPIVEKGIEEQGLDLQVRMTLTPLR
jgi:hypothetical protein